MAAELALALVLLTGAGLMVKSFWRMNARPPGFVPERILALEVPLSGPQYHAVAGQRRFVDEMLQRVQRVPGVQAAGVLVQAQLRGSGAAPHDPNAASLSWAQVMRLPHVTFCTVSSGFDRVMGLRLVRGRWLNENETAPAIVINQSLSHELFGEGNAVGRRLGLGPNVDDPTTIASIVGVVRDLQYSRLECARRARNVHPLPTLFIPARYDGHGPNRCRRCGHGAGSWECDYGNRSNAASIRSQDSRTSAG